MPRRALRGFSLVELLVVIAIIAVVISILLPALKGARESVRTAICQSNVKQVMTGLITYAIDQRALPGTYWQGPINLDWAGRNNVLYTANPGRYTHPLQTSVLRDYLSTMDRILECPTAKREANKFFDYTMIIRFAGARLDIMHTVDYPVTAGSAASPVKVFHALPVLIEEHERYYNRAFDDGSFAGNDQWALRHAGACHIGFLDGAALAFKSPTGTDPSREEPADMTARALRLRRGGMVNQRFEVWSSSAAEFGWVNRPR